MQKRHCTLAGVGDDLHYNLVAALKDGLREDWLWNVVSGLRMDGKKVCWLLSCVFNSSDQYFTLKSILDLDLIRLHMAVNCLLCCFHIYCALASAFPKPPTKYI